MPTPPPPQYEPTNNAVLCDEFWSVVNSWSTLKNGSDYLVWNVHTWAGNKMVPYLHLH